MNNYPQVESFQLKQALSGVKEFLQLDDESMMDLLGLSQNKYNYYKTCLDKVPLSSSLHLADRLGLNIESLITNNFCYQTAQNFYAGKLDSIPLKYQSYDSSKMRTVSNIFDFIKDEYGKARALSIAHKLQISQPLLEQSEQRISGIILMDIYQELINLKCPLSKFYDLGTRAAEKYKQFFLEKYISKDDSPAKVYIGAIEGLAQIVEKNLLYQIERINGKNLIFSAQTRTETREMLKISNFGSLPHCYNIMGWYSEFLTYTGQHQAEITKLSCVHQGDSKCLYRVDYSHHHQ